MRQIYKQTSEKYEVYFNIFHSERRLYSRFISNIIKRNVKRNEIDCITSIQNGITNIQQRQNRPHTNRQLKNAHHQALKHACINV